MNGSLEEYLQSLEIERARARQVAELGYFETPPDEEESIPVPPVVREYKAKQKNSKEKRGNVNRGDPESSDKNSGWLEEAIMHGLKKSLERWGATGTIAGLCGAQLLITFFGGNINLLHNGAAFAMKNAAALKERVGVHALGNAYQNKQILKKLEEERLAVKAEILSAVGNPLTQISNVESQLKDLTTIAKTASEKSNNPLSIEVGACLGLKGMEMGENSPAMPRAANPAAPAAPGAPAASSYSGRFDASLDDQANRAKKLRLAGVDLQNFCRFFIEIKFKFF